MASLAVRWLLLVELLALSKLADGCGVMSPVRRRRVINGDVIRPYQYPWIVSIQSNRSHYCSGVLLSDSFVLTAAHCFIKGTSIASTAEVALGVHDWNEGGAVVSNGTVIIHPAFAARSEHPDHTEYHAEYDVALILLHERVPLGARVQPICLPDRNEPVDVGDEVRMVGWGQKFTKAELIRYLQSGNRTLNNLDLLEAVTKLLDLEKASPSASGIYRRLSSKEPREVTLRLEDPELCYDHFVSYMTNVSSLCNNGSLDALWCASTGVAASDDINYTVSNLRLMVCANRRDDFGQRRSPCYGDSGGPLMKRRADDVWVLLGVTAFGETDCVTNLEGFHEVGTFFANVSLLLKWIKLSIAGAGVVNSALATTVQPLWLLSSLMVIAFGQ